MKFQLVSVVALLGAIALSSAHLGEGGHISQDIIQDLDPHFYCGRNLAKMLVALCVDDSQRTDKRSAGEKEVMYYNMILNPYYKEQDSTWPWLSRHRALEAKVRGRRGMGVATECCDKACNVDELLSYC